MRIGIIGLGRVFNHYLDNFIDEDFLNKHELVICDNNLELASSYQKKLKCKSCNLLNELIEHKPEFVIVASPSGLHYEHTKSLLENNINVLSEKPVCMGINEQNQLIDITNIMTHN